MKKKLLIRILVAMVCAVIASAVFAVLHTGEYFAGFFSATIYFSVCYLPLWETRKSN